MTFTPTHRVTYAPYYTTAAGNRVAVNASAVAIGALVRIVDPTTDSEGDVEVETDNGARHYIALACLTPIDVNPGATITRDAIVSVLGGMGAARELAVILADAAERRSRPTN